MLLQYILYILINANIDGILGTDILSHRLMAKDFNTLKIFTKLLIW